MKSQPRDAQEMLTVERLLAKQELKRERLQILMTDTQMVRLEKACKRVGVTKSEMMRRALDTVFAAIPEEVEEDEEDDAVPEED